MIEIIERNLYGEMGVQYDNMRGGEALHDGIAGGTSRTGEVEKRQRKRKQGTEAARNVIKTNVRIIFLRRSCQCVFIPGHLGNNFLFPPSI